MFALLFLTRLSFPSGYGMSGDLKCVLATWQQFLEEPLKVEGMLDLAHIHQKVTLYPAVLHRAQMCIYRMREFPKYWNV